MIVLLLMSGAATVLGGLSLVLSVHLLAVEREKLRREEVRRAR